MKLALLTRSDYYRDAFFYKYINGKPTEGMENISLQPHRDLSYFINLHKKENISSDPSLAIIKQYKKQLPQENPELRSWID